MSDAVLIARYLPGLGDPFKLTLAQFNCALDRLNDIIDSENPSPDGQERSGQHMRMIQRKKRRQKARERDGTG